MQATLPQKSLKSRLHFGSSKSPLPRWARLGSDSVTVTFDWGYLTGTAVFLPPLVVLVILQIVAKKFHPFLYWATIVASTIFSTTMADFADRSLGIGYSGGSALLLGLLLALLHCGTGRAARYR